ncbi:MAG: PorT family protein [Chlorobi bacterium]|nr:PorT family protein [Chlorobiota bacterium]
MNSNIHLQAQDCTVTLQTARNMYTEGDIEGIPELLKGCIKSGFTKEEKVQAYKLIIQVYLFEDKLQQAEETLLKLKKTNPVYEIDYANDGAEFISLFNEYETKAFLSVGIFGGTNFPSIQITEPFSTNNLKSYNPNYQGASGRFQAGVKVIYQPYNNIELHFEPNFMKTSFSYTSTFDDFFEANNQTSISFDEAFSFINFPVSVTYNYTHKNIVPYIKAGLNLSYLVSATIQLPKKDYLNTSVLTAVTGTDIPVNNYRTKITKNVLFGLGIKYKFPLFFLYAEAVQSIAMDNLVLKSEIYSNTELYGKYQYVDDFIKMHNFTINGGVVYSFYQHKKKEH